MLANSKLNSIETLVSQALTEMKINHEEFIAISKEKDKYEKMKENVRSENEKNEIMRLSSVKDLKQKLSEKQPKIVKDLYHKKVFLCVYVQNC